MSLSVKTIGLLSGYTCKAFFGCKDIYVKKLTHQPQEERESQRSRLPEPSLGSSAVNIRQVLSLHLLSPFFPFTGFLYVLYLPHTFFQLQISTCLGIKEKDAGGTHVTYGVSVGGPPESPQCCPFTLRVALSKAFRTLVIHLLVDPEFIYTMTVIGCCCFF